MSWCSIFCRILAIYFSYSSGRQLIVVISKNLNLLQIYQSQINGFKYLVVPTQNKYIDRIFSLIFFVFFSSLKPHNIIYVITYIQLIQMRIPSQIKVYINLRRKKIQFYYNVKFSFFFLDLLFSSKWYVVIYVVSSKNDNIGSIYKL